MKVKVKFSCSGVFEIIPNNTHFETSLLHYVQ